VTISTLVLLAGAVSRLTRLVVEDSIFEAPRSRLLDRLEAGGSRAVFLGELLSCSWCASVWISFPAAYVAVEWPSSPLFLVPAAALTASAVAGWLGSHE
jgi:hypothetical protein